MQVIKLDAIDSTNDYLKALAGNGFIENFTVVTTENQTRGKGQMGSQWISDKGKNLTVSVLVKDALTDISQIYNLNVAVAVGIVLALEKFNIPGLSIKWPNDIMSDTKKIGGILIENTIRNQGGIVSVVGFGINVNQLDFNNLPKASSLALAAKATLDKEIVLQEILEKIQQNIGLLENGQAGLLWEQYHGFLFRIKKPMPFRNPEGKKFMGIIQNVSPEGKLCILLEDDSVAAYGIKEIEMLY
jgi:BirA family transcriptional regulator, biotin operon repressor / biotin---[acetyl-CoA-carboxylase] ligase